MKEVQVYEFKDKLFVRAPYYSFQAYSLESIAGLLCDRAFLNALFLASPVFYKVLEKLKFEWSALNVKQQLTLKKYFNRMSYRPTPFGAFSSFGLVPWREGQRGVKLVDKGDIILHILPSNEWLIAANNAPRQELADVLLCLNPTLHRLSTGFRYVRTSYNESGRAAFSINELPAEPLNEEVIRKCRDKPVLLSVLSEHIAEQTASSEKAIKSYVQFLIDEQILLTELEGNLFTDKLSEKNGVIGTGRLTVATNGFWRFTRTIPFDSNLSLVNIARELEGLNKESKIVFPGNPFYAGLERKLKSGGIDSGIKQRLLSAVSVLQKIAIPYPTPALKKFIADFKARFENQRVPLLQAVDPDTGIGYGDRYSLAQKEGMLENVAFPEKTAAIRQVDWTEVHRLFLRLWLQNTNRQQGDPVIINREDVDMLTLPGDDYKLPPTLAVMFSCSEGNLVLDNTGGASATSLIGRFSIFNPEIEHLCVEIAADERNANPEVIFAELHQLSDTHVDNINRRSPVYDAVIDINTFPADTGQQHIPLHDLSLRMAGEELLLESENLGKRIVPRLPTAYNFQHNPLAIFQFLCDMQYDGLQANLTFDLEKLFPGLDFYPRVVVDDVVIGIARWRLNDDELKKLLGKPLSIGRSHLFRAERRIPRVVSLGISDQQLVFDLGNDEEALFFLDCLRETRPAVNREYLRLDKNVESDGKPLAGQMIALLKRSDIVYRAAIPPPPHKDTEMIQRDFLPGSEWLYLKIYTTPAAADRLLTSVISPFLKKYDKKIQVWFFIRYRDPESHIRLRVKTTAEKSGSLLNALTNKLRKQQSLVKDIKHEVYRREIERYSPELIEMVEFLFQSGSMWVLGKLQENDNTDLRKQNVAAFDLICRMTLTFIPEAELISFFSWRSESFMHEFGSEKKLRVSLDSKYREYSLEIQTILSDASVRETAITGNDPSVALVKMMARVSEAAQQWSISRRYGLLADLLHMQVNRMFNTRQREHEALLFYGLHKGSLERQARLKNNVSVLDTLADQ